MALIKGICPIQGCEISTATCSHLDRHLKYDSVASIIKPKLVVWDEIEEMATEAEPPEAGQVWALFKKLRAAGLNRSQVGILLRRHGYNMTDRQIIEDMGWTSKDTLESREKKALAVLKRRGGLE